MCEKQIEKTPEWLTPYLYLGVACANLGQNEKAIRNLEHVEQEAVGDAQYSDAERILKYLKSQQEQK
ncbi:MAG: hypothetical protein P9X22_02385 [Candidatus Zapsychrus exili]|nr:hypothetical protein [Candidatus Zapsychrus exili]